MPNTPKSAEQKVAEAEVEGFRQDLGPFVVAAETTRMAMVFTDARALDDPIIFANESFLKLSGYARADVLGEGLKFLLANQADSEASALVEAALAGEVGGEAEVCCRRKDGGTFWAAMVVSPVRNEAGDIVQHFASFVDVTRHRQEEDRLRFLLDELNHRTQNTLATVQAIARQTLRGHADKAVVDAFEGRILALSKAHALLGQENWEAVNLTGVLDRVLPAFGLEDRDVVRFTLEGPEVRLKPKMALTLAMVFHELATNAAKYGALSNTRTGKVDIAWRVAWTPQADRLELRWRESGGPPVTPPTRKGFGTRLIEDGLGRDLDGEVTLDYAPEGLTCEIVMPLPREAGE